MVIAVSPDHQTQRLLFFVASSLNDNIRVNMRECLRRVGASRRWTIAPPCFVDTQENPKDKSRGDVKTETVGGYLEIYSAHPPWTLPREIDLQLLDEVEALVNEMRDFSRQYQLAFEFELDGKFVGSITDGEMDRSLATGLLGEWRRQLG